MRSRDILKKWHKTTVCLCVVSLFLFCRNPDIVYALNEKTPASKPVSVTKDQKVDEKLKNAFQYLQTKNYLKAKEAYRTIYLSAKKGPLAEESLFGMGKADYYLKHYYEARMNLQRFVSQYKESGHLDEAYLLLGNASVFLQKYQDAEQYFNRVGGTFKDGAYVGEASLALESGDFAKADALLGKVNKKMVENDPKALSIRALLYSRKGMHNDAVNTINKISEPMLKEQDVRIDKARIYYDAGKILEAERICKNILSNPSSSTEKVYAKEILLRIFETQGKTDEVLKLSLELAGSEKGDDLKLKIVSLYDQKKDVENALRYLGYVKNKDIRSSEIASRLKEMVDSKNPKATEYVLKYSQYISPENPFMAEASRHLIANGKKNEGTALLKKTTGTQGGETALYLSELLIGEGKHAEAKKLLEGMSFDMRYIARVSTLMTEIMEKEGNYSTAIEYLKRVLKISKDTRIYAMLGNLYWKTGDRSNAGKFYVMASNGGDAASSVKAGDFYYVKGEKKKAEQYYKKALNQKIKDTNDLQWATYQYGKLTGNRDYLQKAKEGGGDISAAASIMLGEK